MLHRAEQGRHRLIQPQVEVALLRFATTATVKLAGAQGRQIFFIERGVTITLNYPGRAEQIRIAVIIGQVGKTAIEFELQLAFATAHTSPTIKQDAGDHNNADDNQPFAQTEFHEIP